MGARPSSFRKGGGFLNGVDGTITGYQFTDEFNGEPFKAGKDPKTKKDRFHSLYFVPEIQVDGADESVTTTLFFGGADDWEVSEDGHTLTPVEEGTEPGASTPFGKFITSMVDAGKRDGTFSEEELPEDEVNYEAIIGKRVRTVQKKDEEGTRKLGKRKDKKTGREYDRTDLVVETVYGGDGDGSAKPAAAKGGKPTKGGSKEPDLNQLATDTLLAILAKNDGKIAKSKLSVQVLQTMGKNSNREDVRKIIFTDDFLGTEAGWSYNKAKGLITADEEQE